MARKKVYFSTDHFSETSKYIGTAIALGLDIDVTKPQRIYHLNSEQYLQPKPNSIDLIKLCDKFTERGIFHKEGNIYKASGSFIAMRKAYGAPLLQVKEDMELETMFKKLKELDKK